jgi:hypothetical protein
MKTMHGLQMLRSGRKNGKNHNGGYALSAHVGACLSELALKLARATTAAASGTNDSQSTVFHP